MAYFRNVTLSPDDFDTIELYERAVIEQERIDKINNTVDITDPIVAKSLLDGFTAHPEMFRTIVGEEFLEVLKENTEEIKEPSLQEILETAPAKEPEQEPEPVVEGEKPAVEEVPAPTVEPEKPAVEEVPAPATEPEKPVVPEEPAATEQPAPSKEPAAIKEFVVSKRDSVGSEEPALTNLSHVQLKQDNVEGPRSLTLHKYRPIKIIFLIYFLYIVCFPKPGLILSLLIFTASVISVLYRYLKGGTRKQMTSCVLSIVFFPVAIVLMIVGIMKKVKYIVFNYRMIAGSLIIYLIPFIYFCNVKLLSPDNTISVLPRLLSWFTTVDNIGKAAIIFDVIIVMIVMISIILYFERKIISQVDANNKRGLNEEQSFWAIMEMPAIVLGMFNTNFGLKVPYEDQFSKVK